MEKPIALERLFNEKIFRIPDYQRGYAWQAPQLKAFWEDLSNLREDRSHYTGVLTLKELPKQEVPPDSREFWLVDDHSYRVYHVVDGQQRLTTAVIFIQAFVDFFRQLPEHAGVPGEQQYVTDSLSVADVEARYLYKMHPRGVYRTYKFGYTGDDSSQDYLRYRVLGETGGGDIRETFYTLNLGNARHYFSEQIAELHEQEGREGLSRLYRKLTKQLLFNQYAIDSVFDVFVSFETMNNRGKKLSDLELLKNRLIYLSTLYSPSLLDVAGQSVLREEINGAWKEVYFQLGRDKLKPLNDDDFLRAHWIIYFKYSRETGRDYARFLLEQHFTPQRVHEYVEREVELEAAEEERSELDAVEQDDDSPPPPAAPDAERRRLEPTTIGDYVASLRDCVGHWFASFHPNHVAGLTADERSAIDRLNRLGMGYFRPLVMVILRRLQDREERLALLAHIERFIFVAFRIGSARSNYRSSEFYNLARSLDRGEVTPQIIRARLDAALSYSFHPDGSLRADEFHNLLFKKFEQGSGYYTWSGLRYFLFEYEQSLMQRSRQAKVQWSDLLTSSTDRISIEHIYPQTPGSEWQAHFEQFTQKERSRYNGSLGNLLLLSMSINASLQNDSFESKKDPKYDGSGRKVRNGYADGSHSEIEVAQNVVWGPAQIRDRGIRLLQFMERRWAFSLRDEDREKLLFLHTRDESPGT